MKTLKVLLSTVVILGMLSTCAFAQDLEAFKTRMANAANMTKQDMSEALLMYLEIRAEYAGPEVDYSLGRVYQRLGQCKEAQTYYTNVMVKYDLSESNAIYKRAITDFDKVASCESWQKFYVDCDVPVGGYVLIDSERMAACWDRSFSLAPGEHTFKLVARDGKETEVKKTSVEGGKDVHVKLAFPVEIVNVEKVVEVEKSFEYKEKYSPYLYWGLMTGGLALVAGGGGIAALANKYYAEGRAQDGQKLYYAETGEKDKQTAAENAREDAYKKTRTLSGVSYALLGVGAATAISGVVLAILSGVGEKEKVESSSSTDVEAFVAPSLGGASIGVNVRF